MRIAISSDHAGFTLKSDLVPSLKELGYDVLDLGTDSESRVDYPDFAELVGKAIQSGEVERGIVICGSGVGACIAANKMRGVYACLCHDAYSAAQGVEHDNMNVLCLGGRIIGIELAKTLAEAFLSAKFQGNQQNGERHLRRVNKIIGIETRENQA